MMQGYELPEDPVVLTAMAQEPSRQRSKNFTQHDKDLALRLLIEHDPKNILASHKWKPEVKAQKQFILSSIHKAFTQEADRKEVTLLQLKRFLHPLRACNVGNEDGDLGEGQENSRYFDMNVVEDHNDEERAHPTPGVDHGALARKRSKNFSLHDKDLALRLLHEYDPNDVLASLKWKPEVRAEKDSILTTIHHEFVLEADRKEVTEVQLKRLLIHLRQKRKLDESVHYETEDQRLSRSGRWEASPVSEALVNDYLEPELNWGKGGILQFQNFDGETKRNVARDTPHPIDLAELGKWLEEHKLQVIAVEDWILIQRASFDVLIAEEPYHSIQIYVNLVTNKYVVRVWGISIKCGDSLTTQDLQELCVYCFQQSAACVGYLGFPPEDRVELVRVNFPRTRWISRLCEVAYPKGHGNLTIGLCPACSGGTNTRKIRRKENLVDHSDQTQESEDRLECQSNLQEEHAGANLLHQDQSGGFEDQDTALRVETENMVPEETAYKQEYSSKEDKVTQKPTKKQRTKNYSPHDRILALRLLKDCDPDGILSCLKWRPEVKEKKETIYADIHRRFTSESERKSVTMEELKNLLRTVKASNLELKHKRPQIRLSHGLHYPPKPGGGGGAKEAGGEAPAPPQVCEQCGAECKSAYRLKRHIETMHKPYSEREFSCDYPGCKTKCVYESALAHHKRVRHGDGFMCDHCGKRLASPGSRDNHIKMVHKKEAVEMKCPECDELFRDYCTRRWHLALVHFPEKYKCEQCGKPCLSSVSKGRMDLHIEGKLNQAIAYRGLPVFDCPECGKTLVSEQALKYHMRIHTGVGLYKCSFCSWQGNTRYLLKRHKRRSHKQLQPDLTAEEHMQEDKMASADYRVRRQVTGD